MFEKPKIEEEGKENFPPLKEIRIYAVERAGEAGKPKEISFVWEGSLHPNEEERKQIEKSGEKGREETVIKKSASNRKIDMLAKGFSSQYMERRDPELEEAGKGSYQLVFEPSEDMVERQRNQESNSSIRGLSPEEIESFVESFRSANEEMGKRSRIEVDLPENLREGSKGREELKRRLAEDLKKKQEAREREKKEKEKKKPTPPSSEAQEELKRRLAEDLRIKQEEQQKREREIREREAREKGVKEREKKEKEKKKPTPPSSEKKEGRGKLTIAEKLKKDGLIPEGVHIKTPIEIKEITEREEKEGTLKKAANKALDATKKLFGFSVKERKPKMIIEEKPKRVPSSYITFLEEGERDYVSVLVNRKKYKIRREESERIKRMAGKIEDEFSPDKLPNGEVDQLTATHCTYVDSAIERRTGDAKDRVLGYSARSSSLEQRSLKEKFRNIEKLLYYYLPKDTPAEKKGEMTHQEAPTRFVYSNVDGVGGVLGNISYRTKDTADRVGSYFAHMIINERTNSKGEKEKMDVLDCLKLYNSDKWQREDKKDTSYDTDKTEIGDFFKEGDKSKNPAVSDDTIIRFLSKEGDLNDKDSVDEELIPSRLEKKSSRERREMFTKILATFLQANESGKTFQVVSEPGMSALLFYSILRTLPKDKRNTLSFSTYEDKADKGTFDLQATMNYDTNKELDNRCYNGEGNVLTYNTFTGKESRLDSNYMRRAEKIVEELLKELDSK